MLEILRSNLVVQEKEKTKLQTELIQVKDELKNLKKQYEQQVEKTKEKLEAQVAFLTQEAVTLKDNKSSIERVRVQTVTCTTAHSLNHFLAATCFQCLPLLLMLRTHSASNSSSSSSNTTSSRRRLLHNLR